MTFENNLLDVSRENKYADPLLVFKASFSSIGPFAGYDHMVQKPPYSAPNCALGHPKQRMSDLSRFVLDVPVRSLRLSMADFVPCDRILQRAHYSI